MLPWIGSSRASPSTTEHVWKACVAEIINERSLDAKEEWNWTQSIAQPEFRSELGDLVPVRERKFDVDEAEDAQAIIRSIASECDSAGVKRMIHEGPKLLESKKYDMSKHIGNKK